MRIIIIIIVSSGKPSTNTGVKNSEMSKYIIIIMKVLNWKTPRHDDIQEVCFKNTSIHDRLIQ